MSFDITTVHLDEEDSTDVENASDISNEKGITFFEDPTSVDNLPQDSPESLLHLDTAALTLGTSSAPTVIKLSSSLNLAFIGPDHPSEHSASKPATIENVPSQDTVQSPEFLQPEWEPPV